MEARIGAQQINQLVKRCGEPRLALILPQEVYDRPFDWVSVNICSIDIIWSHKFELCRQHKSVSGKAI